MNPDCIRNPQWILLFSVTLLLVSSSFSKLSYAAAITDTRIITSAIAAKPPTAVVTKSQSSKVVKEDYFISADTVIIGCSSGMAAGILVGSVPVAGAIMSGIGLPESISLLVNMTGMGCGVGAVSGAVAILTAWMLQPD